MIEKRLIKPERVRQVPKQFSWIDQRLVRDGYIKRCDVTSLALYLFLLTVGDSAGLSYYSDRAIGELLSIDCRTLFVARSRLEACGLIAYKKPLYQVLSLEAALPPSLPPQTVSRARETSDLRSLAQILGALGRTR